MAGAFQWNGPSPMGLAAFVQQQGQMGKQQGEDSRLARLVSGAMADPASRQSKLAEIASFRPEAAFQAQDQLAQQDDRKYAELGKRAAVLLGAPEAMRGQVWAQLRPELEQQFGMKNLPADLTPEVLEMAGQLDRVYGGANSATGVQSTYINRAGQRVAVMRDGSQQVLGDADARTSFTDVPNVGPQIIDHRAATARPVTTYGAEPASASRYPSALVVAGPNGKADADFAALPEAARIRAAELEEQGLPFHIVGGRLVEGESPGLRQPPNQPASQPSPQRPRTAADIPLNEYGGGDERAPAWVRPGATAPGTTPPSGYRYAADGTTLEAIPGGPADKAGGNSVSMLSPEEVAAAGFPKGSVVQRRADGSLVKVHSPTERDTNGGKALPGNIVTQLTEDTEKLNTLIDLTGSFNDKFAGNVVGGSLESFAGRLGGERVGISTPGQAEWWQQYDRYKNVIRNELFGSALTPSEQAAFEAADITPNMDPKVVKSNLARQTALIENVLKRRAAVWDAQGYNPGAVTAATRVTPPARPAAELSDDELKKALGL